MTERISNVLFVDDDAQATQTLIRSLNRYQPSFQCHHASNASEALRLTSTLSPEVAIVDLSLIPQIGPESGFSLITQLLLLEPTLRIFVLTGHSGENFGIQAIQYGAASFLVKPIEPSHLLALILDGISYSLLQRHLRKVDGDRECSVSTSGLSSRNKKMREAIESVAFATTNLQPVFLLGESGTGKGVFAQAIHRGNPTRKGPFIRFQPSFGSQDLISSELFGHKKGAFTGATEDRNGLIEEANEGTLFIDEVDELPHETQLMLLNVLQERVFRRLGETKERRSQFRLIAATNRSFEDILKEKKLRNDFYHRIAHLTISIPALRERPEDIEPLAVEFLRMISNKEKLTVHGFTPQALLQLQSYSFPGNVRELQAKVEGAAYRAQFCERRLIDVSDLGLELKNNMPSLEVSFHEKISRYETALIQDALLKNDHNQTKAAQSLLLDRSTFRRILARSS